MLVAYKIQPYDYVRVKTPNFFIRCGYPMQYEEEVLRIYKKHAQDIMDFMHKVGIKIPCYESNTPRRIARSIAYDLLRQKHFGGYERKIHIHPIPEFQDKDFHVQRVRFVKTGTYEPGHISHTADGEQDYDPPYLSNIKTHRIIATPWIYSKSLSTILWPKGHIGIAGYSTLEIEADNLEVLAIPKGRKRCTEMISR